MGACPGGPDAYFAGPKASALSKTLEADCQGCAACLYRNVSAKPRALARQARLGACTKVHGGKHGEGRHNGGRVGLDEVDECARRHRGDAGLHWASRGALAADPRQQCRREFEPETGNAPSWSVPFWTTRARSLCGGRADVHGRPRMEIEALSLFCAHERMQYGRIIAFCCGGLRLWQMRD